VNSRDLVLARVRAALADVPPGPSPGEAYAALPRGYRRAHGDRDAAATADLLAGNLADYRARVHRCAAGEVPGLVARLLAERGARSVLAPAGLPSAWLSAVREAEVRPVAAPGPGTPEPDAAGLDAVDSVVTGCAVAFAETGTIVLDGGPGQGGRRLTLVPDHHICVVEVPGQVVASVAEALPRLDPARPQTWISGPSATSDIELTRVEGVHGPRTLEVVLAGPDPR
jgi:L-lactate dehydrogenase complex protein LldG